MALVCQAVITSSGQITQFQCRKGIDCRTPVAHLDIMLTPYDIASVKYKPVEGGTACRFMHPDAMERRLARKKEREAELDRIVEKLPTEEFVRPIPEEDKYDKYNHSGS